jgi:hypothetical protein
LFLFWKKNVFVKRVCQSHFGFWWELFFFFWGGDLCFC